MLDTLEPQINTSTTPVAAETKAPDERSGIHLDGFIRISDPETGEIFMETRT